MYTAVPEVDALVLTLYPPMEPPRKRIPSATLSVLGSYDTCHLSSIPIVANTNCNKVSGNHSLLKYSTISNDENFYESRNPHPAPTLDAMDTHSQI